STVGQAAFLARAVTTILTALVAAVCAFRLSIPDADRPRIQYFLPFVALGAWAMLLVVLLASGGDSWTRLAALPINWPCGVKITGLSIVPGCVLFVMLRHAAPLQRGGRAMTPALAATTLAAPATQFICPVDDPAHQIVGHVVP